MDSEPKIAVNPKHVSILLLGPGSGNNITVVLENLQLLPYVHCTLLTRNFLLDRGKHHTTKITEFGGHSNSATRIKMICSMLHAGNYDFLFFLGTGNLWELIPALLLIRRKKTIFNVWGETVPRKLAGNGTEKKLYKWVLAQCDIIQCNWFGTRDLIGKASQTLLKKTIVQSWGIDFEGYTASDTCGKFMGDFLAAIPKGRIVFLNMRSFDTYNEIETSLNGMIILREQVKAIFDKTLLILWHGNNLLKDMLESAKTVIRENGLSDNVWLIQHPFLEISDVAKIIERANVIVNFVNRDQFSVSLMEGMFFKKELLCSDIEAYRIVNDALKTQINLIEISPQSYAREVIRIVNRIDKGIVDYELLEHRKQVIQERFAIKNAIKKIENLLLAP